MIGDLGLTCRCPTNAPNAAADGGPAGGADDRRLISYRHPTLKHETKPDDIQNHPILGKCYRVVIMSKQVCGTTGSTSRLACL